MRYSVVVRHDLVLLVLIGTACSWPNDATVMSERAFSPPPWYVALWGATRQCGVQSDVRWRDITWHEAEAITWKGRGTAGLWYPTRRLIVLTRYAREWPTHIAHEMLHARGHDHEQWIGDAPLNTQRWWNTCWQ